MPLYFSLILFNRQDGIDTSVVLSESDPPEVALVESSTGGVVQSGVPLISVAIRITNAVDAANEKLSANPLSPITVRQIQFLLDVHSYHRNPLCIRLVTMQLLTP